jgi:ElaB/YqjD/DUF883 family membrane-anchored ribosome-binding protein
MSSQPDHAAAQSTNAGERLAPSDSSQSTTEKIAARAHDTVDRVADRSASAEQKIREQAERASEQFRATEERAKAIATESARTVESYIERNPIMSAGVAFVAGLILSNMLRR